MNHQYFTLQWHITANCDYLCNHCYMYEEKSFHSEIHHQLSYNQAINLMDDFVKMTKRLSRKFHKPILPAINFTGGDPFLREDFADILQYANSNHITIGILGNPTYLTSENISLLNKYKVVKYQLSLDGLKETHDNLRKAGSFDDTLLAIQKLQKSGIKTHIMFTLSDENKGDLIPLIHLMVERKVDHFAFARLSEVGMGKKINSAFNPLEYREFLLKIHQIYTDYQSKGVNTYFALKDHLWILLHYELDLFKLSHSNSKIAGGCGIGIGHLVVLADGEVYACRRFPSSVGRFPDSTLYDIFIHSKQLNQYRQFSRFTKCSSCNLLNYCRGCPAVAYGTSGDSFAPDPQCWK